MDGLSRPPARGDLQGIAAALTAALSRVPGDLRAAAWQDGLDLIAVLDGLKPICVVGHGGGGQVRMDTLHAIAAPAGLSAIDAAPWAVEDAGGVLPPWYAAASERMRARQSVLYLCRGEVALPARGRVTAAEEARLLGYPLCCVAAHHRRTLALGQLVAELAEQIAGGDIARRTRMIETGAAPLPRTARDWRRYEAATECVFAPFTSIAMCGACAADRDSPAQILSQAYQALAARVRYEPI